MKTENEKNGQIRRKSITRVHNCPGITLLDSFVVGVLVSVLALVLVLVLKMVMIMV